MTDAAHLSSGKGHRDENFPVASWLVRRELRPAIIAFYRFARAADDVADLATTDPVQKLALLGSLEAGLRGDPAGAAEGVALCTVLGARGLTDRHALDLLQAFRRDVGQHRYADWNDLMDYCRFSAAPVGRFVLDLHGEPRSLWPANDALCTALQVINHLQDCAKDYRDLDRVYIPLDTLAGHGVTVEALGAPRASAGLGATIADVAARTGQLLDAARPLAGAITDRRLALEVGVIQSLAESLVLRVARRDPLSERVHHRSVEVAGLALRGVVRVAARRARQVLSPRRTGLQSGRG